MNFAVEMKSSTSWGDKQLFPPQQIPEGALDPQREIVRRKIVLYHNFFRTKNWFVEYKNFTYADPDVDLPVTGHYTQMVWATSHKVGCGLAHCPGGPWGHFYNYVCHYCPGGNFDTITQFPYKKGKPCDDCPNHCVSGTLCNNPCYKRDVYSNCAELVHTVNGFCNQGMCNATCDCGNEKIHKNYPWGQ
ncbi:Catrin [Operophtera brumata]|uniref:Catrin n=1 Tax=Operophtera brumata TaxID=104452 RepID=A0A0L7LEN1_OPEBR|nr:Catrin [Operophtera brumata]